MSQVMSTVLVSRCSSVRGEAVAKAFDAAEAGADHVIFYLLPPPRVKDLEELGEAALQLASSKDKAATS